MDSVVLVLVVGPEEALAVEDNLLVAVTAGRHSLGAPKDRLVADLVQQTIGGYLLVSRNDQSPAPEEHSFADDLLRVLCLVVEHRDLMRVQVSVFVAGVAAHPLAA